MRSNPFESQLERLARTLTESYGVSLMCQGDNAYTDGQRIVLPSLPEPMKPELERMIIGFLDHEGAHVIWSDFDEVAKFNRTYPGCEGMLNVVEDALIEQRAMQRWPGARANLDALFKQVKRRVRAALRKASPFRRFCTAVYLQLSHHTDMLGLKQEIVGCEDLLAEFKHVQTTADSAALAEQLLKRWARQQQQQPGDTGGDTDSGMGDGKAGDGAGKKTGAGNNASNPGAGDDAATNNTGDRSGQPNREDDGCNGATSSSNKPSGLGDGDTNLAQIAKLVQDDNGRALIGEVINTTIERAVADASRKRMYRVYSREHDRLAVVPTATDIADVRDMLAGGEDEVRRLRRGLTNALRSAEKRWWREEQPRGLLSPKSLHQLCTDRHTLNVFRTRALVQGQSTAVSILLDASGSMAPRRMDVARDTVRVLLLALSDLKIPTEALTFTTGDYVNPQLIAAQEGTVPGKLRKRFSRICNLEIGLVKRFEDSAKTAVQRLPNVQSSGLTPLGEAMEIAARRLIVRPENRKIGLVVTDGKPACDGSSAACITHACEVAERIANVGIELVGVGIQDDCVQQIIPNSIVVNELEELPVRLCKQLGRTLTKGLKHVG